MYKHVGTFFLCLLMGLAILLFGVGEGMCQKASNPVLIRYGTDLPPHMPPVVGQHWWAEEVTKRTQGRVKVEMYPASSLSTQAAALQNVLSGVCDMYMLSTGVHYKAFPLSSITVLPGVGFADDTVESNMAHMQTFMELLKRYPPFAAEYKDFGAVVFYVIYSQTYLISKGKPIRVPSDLKGLKVGCGGIRVELVTKLEAAPVMDIPPTAYEKLQTGVTQATFVAASAALDFKLYEVANYILDVPFGGGGHPIVINKDTWNKISAEDRKLMVELGVEAARISHKAIAELNRKAWKEMEARGMKVAATKEERRQWEERFKELWEEWIAKNEARGIKEAREIFNFWKNAADKTWAR